MKKYCKECKKEITTGSKQGFCKSCSKKGTRNNMFNCKGKLNPAYIDGRTLKKHYCLDCKKKIIDYKAKRCHSCAIKYCYKIGKLKKLQGKNHWSFKHGKTHNNKCIDCNSHITFYSKRCCSCETKRKHKEGLINIRGKNNPSYKDGTGNYPYPSDFSKALKYKIFKRDNFTCQRCLIYSTNKLSVHHIDYNRNHNNKDNLITLCMSCNIKANFNRDYWYAYFRYILNNFKRRK